MESEEEGNWTTTIESERHWYAPDLRGLWQYRDLVMLFVRRDFVAIYKQSLLGPLWFALQPALTTVVFTIVFGHIASIPTDGAPPFLFYFTSVVCWQYFAGNVIKTSDTFVTNANIFGKVYFPRLTAPVSIVISNLLQFGIQFAVLACLIGWSIFRGAGVTVGPSLLLLPLLLVQMAALGLGVGLAVSALTTRYRDLAYLMSFGLQLWMYATPVVYPVSQIPQRWLWLAYLNPMTSVVESFRYVMLGVGGLTLELSMLGIAVTLAVLTVGLFLFARVERLFMDTV